MDHKTDRTPAWLHTWAARNPALAARWLQADPRSLGLMRLVLGALLIADLLRRWCVLQTWYTNAGLLPNHTLLWRPPSQPQISLFFTASTAGQAAVLFTLCGLVYAAFTLGYKTRLFHALSFVALLSLHGRTQLFEDGSEVTLHLLCAFTLFLPLGIRFSIDAVATSLRSRKELRPESLADRQAFAGPHEPVASFAVFAVLLQLVAIYFFNVIHKTGVTWKDGSAFHYVLHQDRIVTWLGHLIRPHVSWVASKAATWSALGIEAAIAMLLVCPWQWKRCRRGALVFAIALHMGFAAFLNLGMFSFNMLGFFVVLLTDADWASLARWFGPAPKRARVVYFDAGCGVCFALARWLARMDLLGRLTLRANDSEDRPASLSEDLILRTIVVDDPATGRRFTESAAFAQIFCALPGLAPLGWLLQMPPVLWVANPFYKAFSRNRAHVSALLGMAACGIPGSTGVAAPPAPWRTPLHDWLDARFATVRECVLLIVVCACVLQGLKENAAVPHALKIPQPAFLQAVVEYPRLLEGWSMFAPNAPTTDQMIAVEARTVDGRIIDPLAIASARVSPAPVTEIPERLGNDEFFCDYINQIANRPEYFGAFGDWILSHHKRTGHPADRVESFAVFALEDQSPPPGQTQATGTKKTLLFEGRARDP
ncbi:MAG: DCC1-like thiol-disulfide oxidoreductase family protein [Deltaproteobacteria bacterium]|nr:DCC1-like thiol-disulfide oxidoreductase family protein [Deltaproteobacteria bacterium]